MKSRDWRTENGKQHQWQQHQTTSRNIRECVRNERTEKTMKRNDK